MKYNDMLQLVKILEFDKEQEVLKDGRTSIYIFRPSKLSARFKNYDLKRNFQIYLNENERRFRPNHLRVMIDLNLRVRSRPDLKHRLLQIFDNIFYGNDPDEEIKILSNEGFEHYLNPIKVIANLSQLFLIEQDYGYHKESKYDPPTLFYQGWIRQFIDSPKEIDNLCMSVCRFIPPEKKYVYKENKKDKGYEENLKELWYLD